MFLDCFNTIILHDKTIIMVLTLNPTFVLKPGSVKTLKDTNN